MKQSTATPTTRRRTGLRIAAAGAVAATLAVSGATVAAAAGNSPADSRAEKEATSKVASARIMTTGAVAGGPCAVGYHTDTAFLTPPDASVADNVPAGQVVMTKRCSGPVIGSFVSETFNDAATDNLYVSARATCIHKAGLPASCTVGQQVVAQPGFTFLELGDGVTGTRPFQPVWPHLLRGRWRFEIEPGGDGTASLGYRSFTVSAYTR